MWSDRDTVDDCLGFAQYVASLGDVCIEQDIAPLTLGIFGSWGSGKTSLMRMLQREVESREHIGNVKTLWFNAWRYEGKDEIQSALINAILAKLKEGQTLGQEAVDVLKRLRDGASILRLAKVIGKSAITLTPDIGGFIEAFNDESEKVATTMAAFEADFENLLRQLRIARVVVFIDDLDRCQSAKIIETFETIKLFLNIPECTFVLGADDAKIRQAIIETYRVIDQSDVKFSEDYLEKIIQLPFRIPEQRLEDIKCYVSMLFLKREINAVGWSTLLGDRATLLGSLKGGTSPFPAWIAANGVNFDGGAAEATSHLAAIEPYIEILGRGLRGNPRQIKRFLNILALRQRLAAANALGINTALLIKLLVVEYTWKPFFRDLVETTDPVSGKSTLLEELLAVARGEADMPADSNALKIAIETPGLRDFLVADPTLDGNVDLGPYLFLSQTALGADRPPAVQTLEETAKTLVARIASDDRIRSKAAILQARRQDSATLDAIIRQLRAEFPTITEPRRQVHALGGFLELCELRPATYPAVVELLGQIEPGANQALALTAVTFLDKADRAGTAGSATLKQRFAGTSRIMSAATGQKRGKPS